MPIRKCSSQQTRRVTGCRVYQKGGIEHHFYAVTSISIVFIEVKKNLVVGKGKLDIIGQVLLAAGEEESFDKTD